MAKLIGIIGKAKSGKDTIAKYLTRKWGFKRVAFADKLKDVCKELYGLNDYQLRSQAGKESVFKNGKTIRTILQETGDGLRSVYLNVWVDYLCNAIKNESCPIVVSDVRRVNELQSLIELDAKIIRIKRKEHLGLSGKEALHGSEIELDNIDERFITDTFEVGNGEIPELYDYLDDFIKDTFPTLPKLYLSYSVVQTDTFSCTWHRLKCNFNDLYAALDFLEEAKSDIKNLSFSPSLGVEINTNEGEFIIASVVPILSADGRTYVWSDIIWEP